MLKSDKWKLVFVILIVTFISVQHLMSSRSQDDISRNSRETFSMINSTHEKFPSTTSKQCLNPTTGFQKAFESSANTKLLNHNVCESPFDFGADPYVQGHEEKIRSGFKPAKITSSQKQWMSYNHNIDRCHSTLKIYYCPIYKAATSTWLALFTKLSGALTEENEKRVLNDSINFPNLAREFRMVYGMSTVSKAPSESSLKMTVVRHPFSRILSAYRNKLDGEPDYYRKRYGAKIIQMFRKQNEGLSPKKNYTDSPPLAPNTPTFLEFCKYLIQSNPTALDEHWIPQYLHCSPCSTPFDVVFKAENLEEDTESFLSSLGYDVASSKYNELKAVLGRWRNPSTHKHEDEYYWSQLTKKDLMDLYALYYYDFKLFGYTIDKYLDMVKK